jgi:8-hydroxy-5-deazaflavin:NADPH oxidoreductase
VNIAIIGGGNVGRALASSTIKAGHNVTISASTYDHAVEAAAETGATPAHTNTEAVQAADVVILAVPASAHGAVARELASELIGTPVVDVANRPTPDPGGSTTSLAEELQARMPGVPVMKAFNTAFASRQAEPTIDGVSADGFVAGDEEPAKARVLELVESIGFRPIDAGKLAVARTLEGAAWLNISLNMQNGWPWQSAWKLVGPTGS